ncbi:MAG: HlyD family efflux transporter periplasmic adaptor subunit [Reichenbachiella sp.]
MRQISIVVGILLIIGAVFGAKTIIDSKPQRKAKAEKVINTAFVETVKNGNVPINIIENGRLIAKNKMDLYSEVQGVMQVTRKDFKPGSRFKKGEVLVKVKNNDYYANLQAQKSILQNLITSILPDLRLDYPEAYKKWDAYLQNFDMNKPITSLPSTTSDKEKFFITGKNIYTTYYNTKNLELIYEKYNIRAPFSGVLTEASVNPGTVIRPGQRLGEFIDPSVYEMHVSVSQSMITSISIGKKVVVRQPDNPDQVWMGEIIRINGKVDPSSQTVQVFIEIRGNDLKEGMYLEATIPGKEKPNAYEVNRRLLVDEEYLYTVSDSTLQLAPISILHRTQKTVVVSGLTNGTQLLSRAVPGSYEGMKVSIYSEK